VFTTAGVPDCSAITAAIVSIVRIGLL
jgi:hypothetical protein